MAWGWLITIIAGGAGGGLACVLSLMIPRQVAADSGCQVYRCLPPVKYWRCAGRAALSFPAGWGWQGGWMILAGGLMLWPVAGRLPDIWLPGWLLSSVLLALAVIDFRHGLLPDRLTLPLLWAGLLLPCFGSGQGPEEAVAGAALGYLLFWGIGWGWYLFTGQEGMGYGDAKLAAALGAWLGAEGVLQCLMMAAMLGLVHVGILRGTGQQAKTLPFGPALAFAGWWAWLCQAGVSGCLGAG